MSNRLIGLSKGRGRSRQEEVFVFEDGINYTGILRAGMCVFGVNSRD